MLCHKYVLFLATVYLLFCGAINAARDDSACNPPDEARTPSGGKMKPPNRPTVNNEFETHIVLNIITRNFTTELHQYFSFDSDHSMIEQTELGHRFNGYANYKTNEFIQIYPDTHMCKIDPLSSNENRFIFGYKKSFGGGHVPTAAAVLHVLQPDDDSLERYVGKETIRGIPCHVWYTCTYWKEMESTMDLYWYFSDPDHWKTGTNVPSIPVRAWVKGLRYDTASKPRYFEHKYDFIHWKNKITRQNYYQTPRAVSCPGRVNTKPLPPLARQFSFTVEQVYQDLGLVTFIEESYDNEKQFFQYKYRTNANKLDLFGDTVLREVHDFNTGVAYVIDTHRGNCSVMPIETNALDDINTDQTHVRIRSAVQFLYLDDVQPTYEGVKNIRGIDCDVWVTTRTNFPPGTHLNSTFEWAFVADTYSTESQELSEDKGGQPIQLAITQGDSTSYYNIYRYRKTAPSLLDYNIGSCFWNRNRRIFDFGVPGSVTSQIGQNLKSFKLGLVDTVSRVTGISPLRIANINVRFADTIRVRLVLLDKAPITGSTDTVKQEVDLSAAGDRLLDAIRTGGFVVPLEDSRDSVSTTSIRAIPSSVKEKEYIAVDPNDGVATDVSAGIGAGLGVLGLVSGIGLAFIVMKKFFSS